MSKQKISLGFKILKYMIWPFISCILLLLLTFYSYQYDTSLGFVALISFLLNLTLFIVMLILGRRRIIKETINLSLAISDIQKAHLENFDIPHCILDATGRIRWYNNRFYDLVKDPRLLDKNIRYYFPQVNADQLPAYEEKIVKIIENDDETYKVVIDKHRIETSISTLVNGLEEHFFYNVYFLNITKESRLQRINQDQKAIIGYIYVDNYDEILHSIEDVRRPLLVALLDRNLNKFAKSIGGIVRKMEKDKYVLFFQKKYLDKLKKEKFSILDDIRNINIGNELPVSISIGLGIHSDNYAIGLEYARVAIDLALGRGGDQAVIKNEDNFSFYGGKNRGVETNTRVKARMKAYAFKELINESDDIIIMGHKNQDMDSLGAAFGIYACAKMLNKRAYILLDHITLAVKPLYERVKESSNFPDDIFISGAKSLEILGENTAVIIVDVNRPSYVEYPELLNAARKHVVFDHHRVATDYIENSVLNYIEPFASSTCEMVTEILRYISDKVKLDPIEADALFGGIYLDTKNFSIKTGVKTFEAAAFLKRNGADVLRVKRFFMNDMESYMAKVSVVKEAKVYRDTLAIASTPPGINNSILIAAQAADELLNIQGIKASFVLTEVSGVVYISARSFEDMNVQLVMEKLGGGGHLSVAGAQIEGKSIDEAIVMLKAAIDNYIEKGVKE